MDNWKEEHKKGHFWIANRFIERYAKDLSVYTQMVYVALCRYAGKQDNGFYETFVGCRKIGNNLKINKNTVADHRKELEAYGLIRRLKNKNGRATHYRIYTDPCDTEEPYALAIHKELKDNKEESNFIECKESNEPEIKKNKKAIDEVREILKKKGVYKK
jgi:methyltransferase-like protein